MAAYPQTTPQTIAHLINRVSFGARPGDRSRVESVGFDTYIQEQLHPATVVESTALTQTLQTLRTQTQSAVTLFQQHSRAGGSGDRAPQQQLRNQIVAEAVQARLLHAVISRRQLQELMVDFWFNHFNVYAYQNMVALWLGSYDRDAIRPHALGSFRQLLGAIATHPAMLRYLDNWRNTDPNGPGATGVYQGINENYARELLELHTLGVDGGYTQADVEALAWILTGWSVMEPGQTSTNEYGFYFAHDRHASGNKQLLGTVIHGGGREEGEAALDVIAAHPATARFISYKLAQYFVSDRPPTELVNHLANQFQSSHGDIAAVLAALFAHPAFWQPDSRKLRTPYQYVVAIARVMDLAEPLPQSLNALESSLDILGMPLYQFRPPNGYSNTQDAWLSPDAILRRIEVVQRLVNSHQELTADIASLCSTISPNLSSQTRDAIAAAPARLQAIVALGSPEMMYR